MYNRLLKSSMKVEDEIMKVQKKLKLTKIYSRKKNYIFEKSKPSTLNGSTKVIVIIFI